MTRREKSLIQLAQQYLSYRRRKYSGYADERGFHTITLWSEEKERELINKVRKNISAHPMYIVIQSSKRVVDKLKANMESKLDDRLQTLKLLDFYVKKGIA